MRLGADTIFAIIVAVFVVAMAFLDAYHVGLFVVWTFAVAAVVSVLDRFMRKAN